MAGRRGSPSIEAQVPRAAITRSVKRAATSSRDIPAHWGTGVSRTLIRAIDFLPKSRGSTHAGARGASDKTVGRASVGVGARLTRQAGSLAQKQIRLAPIIPSMPLQKLMATLATMVLFGSGAAAAALADSPPTTTEPTTSTETTATTETTSTETTTTTSTETTTTPAETTTTAPTTATTTASSPPRREPRTQTLPNGASLSDAPSPEKCDRRVRIVRSTGTESRSRSRSRRRLVKAHTSFPS